jgi:hypothetical protein
VIRRTREKAAREQAQKQKEFQEKSGISRDRIESRISREGMESRNQDGKNSNSNTEKNTNNTNAFQSWLKEASSQAEQFVGKANKDFSDFTSLAQSAFGQTALGSALGKSTPKPSIVYPRQVTVHNPKVTSDDLNSMYNTMEFCNL